MKNKVFKVTIIFFLFNVLFFLLTRPVMAAKFTLNPSAKTVNVDQEFQVSLILDTQGKEVNAVQAKLFFEKTFLQITNVVFSNIFPSNFKLVDNENGLIQIASDADTSFTSFNGVSSWATLTLKAKNQGLATLRFSCPDSLILEKGTVSNLLDCVNSDSGSYTLVLSAGNGSVPASSPPSGGGTSGCTELSPDVPTGLRAESGPEKGEVKLTWSKVSGVSHYSLVFGTQSRSYQWGAANIGDTDQYIVRQLTPGKLYYFAIAAVRNCASSGFSAEVSARAKGALSVSNLSLVSPQPTSLSPSYQPIEEVFTQTIFPSPVPVVEITVEPTPTSLPELPESEASFFENWGKKIILFVVPLALLVIISMIFVRRKPPEIPSVSQFPSEKSDTTISPPSKEELPPSNEESPPSSSAPPSMV